MQQLMLDAPFGDDLCVITAMDTEKSWGIVMLVARDALTLVSGKF